MTLDEAQEWADHYDALGDACPFRVEMLVNAVGVLNERQPDCGISWDKMWPKDDAWLLVVKCHDGSLPVSRMVFNPDELALAQAVHAAIKGNPGLPGSVDRDIAQHRKKIRRAKDGSA